MGNTNLTIFFVEKFFMGPKNIGSGLCKKYWSDWVWGPFQSSETGSRKRVFTLYFCALPTFEGLKQAPGPFG